MGCPHIVMAARSHQTRHRAGGAPRAHCACARQGMLIVLLAALPLVVVGAAGGASVEGKTVAQASAADEKPSAEPLRELADDFNGEKLDEQKWAITRKNDFAEFAVDLAPVKEREGDRRLRLRCGTIGTDDRSVKFLGVVSRAPVALDGKTRLTVEFDWNNQANGCYLTGAVYLCPTSTAGNPADEPQWLALEYVGVPPGKNARAALWLKDKGAPRWVYDEGWPREQRTGRPVGKVKLEILCEAGRWKVLEDGKLLFDAQDKHKLPFDRAHVYLQMSSHSNYPPRELFFDNLKFGPEPVP